MINWNIIIASINQATQTRFEMAEAMPLTGGCINQAWHINSRNGTHYFVKLNDAAKLPMFAAESAGLIAIAATHTVRVPQPIAQGTSDEHAFLVLEYLDLAGSGNARLLGQQLAALHRCSTSSANVYPNHVPTITSSSPPPCRGGVREGVEILPSYASTPILSVPLQGGKNEGMPSPFGFAHNNFIGATSQPNAWTTDWPTFWCEQRLGFQLDLAARNGYGGELQKMGQQLMQRLPEFFVGYHPVPSLLHGDLWGGNHSYTADGTPVLFDPAPYYGDREADLAMTELFGGFDQSFYAAYHTVWPLDAGYATRKILYNLYHILNHANLFGGGYARQAEGMMRRLLGNPG